MPTVPKEFSKLCYKTSTSVDPGRCEEKKSLPDAQLSACRDSPSGPSRSGRKTRRGSLGRDMLIIRDCPGSVMGNKLSVISQGGSEELGATSPRVSPSVTRESAHRKEDVDELAGKCSPAEDIIMCGPLATPQRAGRRSKTTQHNISLLL